MTTEPVVATRPVPRTSKSDVLLDGLFTGMIGALIVAIWFLVLDLAQGHPLWTPALLGNVLLHGAGAAQQTTVDTLNVAAYTAVHFLAFIGVGIALSWAMSLFDRFPIMFFVLLVMFLSLQVGFLGLDTMLGAELMHKLKPWAVVVANVLAAIGMGAYLWRRHPSVLRGMNQMWDAEHLPDRP
jgi:hypothetical protein